MLNCWFGCFVFACGFGFDAVGGFGCLWFGFCFAADGLGLFVVTGYFVGILIAVISEI